MSTRGHGKSKEEEEEEQDEEEEEEKEEEKEEDEEKKEFFTSFPMPTNELRQVAASVEASAYAQKSLA